MTEETPLIGLDMGPAWMTAIGWVMSSAFMGLVWAQGGIDMQVMGGIFGIAVAAFSFMGLAYLLGLDRWKGERGAVAAKSAMVLAMLGLFVSAAFTIVEGLRDSSDRDDARESACVEIVEGMFERAGGQAAGTPQEAAASFRHIVASHDEAASAVEQRGCPEHQARPAAERWAEELAADEITGKWEAALADELALPSPPEQKAAATRQARYDWATALADELGIQGAKNGTGD